MAKLTEKYRDLYNLLFKVLHDHIYFNQQWGIGCEWKTYQMGVITPNLYHNITIHNRCVA